MIFSGPTEKRIRVSPVRHFPPGSGPTANRASETVGEEGDCSGRGENSGPQEDNARIRVSAIKNNFPAGCGLAATQASDIADDEEEGEITQDVWDKNKVRGALRLFHVVRRALLQEEEAKSRSMENVENCGKLTSFDLNLKALKIMRDNRKCVNNEKKIIGCVPGIEVGHEFQYRAELSLIGLHHPTQHGIDYLRSQGSFIIATSVVASGRYDNDMSSSDVLIYTGSGGNLNNVGKKPEDQKLNRSNLALKNSIQAKNPVRVIRAYSNVFGSSPTKGKKYIYDGLYVVEKYWLERGPHGKLVFKYRLTRIPGQPELAWKAVKKSKKFEVHARGSLGSSKRKRCYCVSAQCDGPMEL